MPYSMIGQEGAKCTRCGWCCIVAPCSHSEAFAGEVCESLVVHEDLTTSCLKIKETGYIGTGCFLQANSVLKKIYEETYAPERTKQVALERKQFYTANGAI